MLYKYNSVEEVLKIRNDVVPKLDRAQTKLDALQEPATPACIFALTDDEFEAFLQNEFRYGVDLERWSSAVATFKDIIYECDLHLKRLQEAGA